MKYDLRFEVKIGGRERGIRTPGGSHLNGFQDRRFRPLSHLPMISTHDQNRYARDNHKFGGDTQIRTGESRLCRPMPYHLAMSPLRVSLGWCPRPDLNRYRRNVRGILSPLCLPISPPGHITHIKIVKNQSRKPDENKIMERETGIEPAAPTLARLCSTTELFPHE